MKLPLRRCRTCHPLQTADQPPHVPQFCSGRERFSIQRPGSIVVLLVRRNIPKTYKGARHRHLILLHSRQCQALFVECYSAAVLLGVKGGFAEQEQCVGGSRSIPEGSAEVQAFVCQLRKALIITLVPDHIAKLAYRRG